MQSLVKSARNGGMRLVIDTSVLVSGRKHFPMDGPVKVLSPREGVKWLIQP